MKSFKNSYDDQTSKKWRYLIYKMLDQNRQRNKGINLKSKQRRDEDLSFNYVQKLMKHDSFKRHKGALRQVGWADNEDT